MTSPPQRPGFRIGAAAMAVVVVVGFFWLSTRARPSEPPVFAAIDSPPMEASESVLVHVGGAVRSPGLVELDPGARVADAIAAAGGATVTADLTAVNLATMIDDGAQIIVPSLGDPVGGTASAAGPPGDGRVDVNAATAIELTALPGVGAVLAGRIVEYREGHGPFATIEDLLDVPGIGEGKLSAIRDTAYAG